MSKNEKLTELLTQDPLDPSKLFIYCRSKRFDAACVGKLAETYCEMKKKHSQVTPLHVACYCCFKPDIVRTLVEEGWDVNKGVEEFGCPLGIALDTGNISIATLLIELGADINKLDYEKCTPMSCALTTQKKEKTCVVAVKLLLDSGVSVDVLVEPALKQRAIHVAVKKRMLSVVSLLLQRGANPNRRDIDGHTPIHLAVMYNHLEMVKLLLLHCVNLYKESRALRETPIVIAVKEGYVEIIKELVKGGCDVNKPCAKINYSPIHSAVYCSAIEVIKLLITLGANPNNTLSSGVTPLHIVASGNLRKKTFPIEKDDIQNIKDVAECLVDFGANINAADNCENTPLKTAIQAKCWGLAKFFIKLGADVNTRNNNGDTIFHQVVQLNTDIITVILDFGGDYTAYNKNKLTPYHLAITNVIDLKYIKSFIKHGCPYNQDISAWFRSLRGKEIEHFYFSEIDFFKGIKENNLELVQCSVEDGAVPSSRSKEMKYPLHFVALCGYKEILTFLLEKNVQPNTLNEEGKTPLHLAASKGHYDCCRILLRHGACYNYRSRMCPKTPRVIASDLKHDAIVDLFDSIDDMFCKAKSKKRTVLKYLQNKIKNNLDYVLFVNVTNTKGNNLLTTALQYKCNFNAEHMMKMRLQYNLDSK